MDPERWDRLQQLFHSVADLRPEAQEERLAHLVGDDAQFAAELRRLIEAEREPFLLDRDVAHVAERMLSTGEKEGVPGIRFGPYRLLRLLGEGGMGVVYLAERDDLGSVAAVKVLRDAWLSPSRRERFAVEQRTLAQLTHPGIARLYDVGALADGTPWFVMEYVEGEPLTTYCARRRASIADRLRLLREVCVAVQHAHRHAIVHRDLKPSNILVTADGSVKLLDFGIAKQLDGLAPGASETRTGLRLMTLAYAAPEQVRSGRVGIHTDVYALGVVLYELLTGRLPFAIEERTPGEAEELIVGGDPERPSIAAANTRRTGEAFVPFAQRSAWGDLDVLCLTAMHRDPQRRYASVDALIRDIDHFLGGEPLEARPDSIGYRATKFARRNWRMLAAAVVLMALSSVMLATHTMRLAAARDAATAEAERVQRIQRFMLALFVGGDASVAPPDSLRVLTLLERGMQEARALDSEPELQAELFLTLGGIFRKLGDLPRADSLIRGALALRESRLGRAHPDVAIALVALGGVHADRAEYDEGERLIREGLAVNRRVLSPMHPGVAEASAELGALLTARGEYDGAVQVLEEVVALRSRSRTPTAEVAMATHHLANAHFYAGRYAVADSLNGRVLAMSRALYGERHPNVADDYINLGAVRFQLGRYDEAERYYREGLEIITTWYGEHHYRTAAALTMLGRALVAQQRFEDGEAALLRALFVQEAVFGADHPRVASALNDLGIIALQRDLPEVAQGHYERTLGIYRRAHGERHHLIGITYSNLASVASARGDHSEAERLMRRALDQFAATLPASHMHAGVGRIKLGRALLRQRRFRDAEQATLSGYDILLALGDSTSPWTVAARTDLALAYDELKMNDRAADMRLALDRLQALQQQ